MNIFDVIKKIDAGKYDYYSSLNEEDRKELDKALSFPLLRWMSGSDDDDMMEVSLELINEIVNPNYFALSDHKELQYKLLVAAGARTFVKRKWFAPVGAKSKNRIYDCLCLAYPDMKADEVDMWLDINGRDGLEELTKMVGIQKEDRQKILEEYDRNERKR